MTDADAIFFRFLLGVFVVVQTFLVGALVGYLWELFRLSRRDRG